jgi:hypothetical protein
VGGCVAKLVGWVAKLGGWGYGWLNVWYRWLNRVDEWLSFWDGPTSPKFSLKAKFGRCWFGWVN